jgi:16S rRNA C1402 (ribose-2'-O) methylase RsmI
MKARGHVFLDFTDVVIDCAFNLVSAARRNRHQQAISQGAKSGILATRSSSLCSRAFLFDELGF